MTGVRVSKKRIVIGVNCESTRKRVQQFIQEESVRLSFPLEAVAVEITPRPLLGPPVFECRPPEVVDPETGLSTPGFGGIYGGESGIVNVYMLEPSQEKAEEIVLEHYGPNPDREVRVIKGQYTWDQLIEWHDELGKGGIWGIPGIHIMTVDPSKNRITIEVDPEMNSNVVTEVEDVLSRRPVPRAAVILLDWMTDQPLDY